MPRASGMAEYVRDGYGAFRQHKFECGSSEMPVSRACDARQKFFVFCLYCNRDLDDPIYQCFLTSMAAVQAEDVLPSFLLMDELNGHHQGW